MGTLRRLGRALAEAMSRFRVGQRFAFQEGDRVICNGHPGVVTRVRERSVEVRLPRGHVEVDPVYPDCYPEEP